MRQTAIKKQRTGLHAALRGVVLLAAAIFTVKAALTAEPFSVGAAQEPLFSSALSEALLDVSLNGLRLPEKSPLEWIFPRFEGTAEMTPMPVETSTPYRADPVSPRAGLTAEDFLIAEEDENTTPDAISDLPADAGELMAVTFAPASPEGYDAANGIFINNKTGQSVDIPALAKQKSSLRLSKDEPQILIIHTHGSESFFPDERDYYVPTDIERTEDTRFNVVRLGDELTGIFEQKGLNVIHDRAIYDYPTYNGAYTRALDSITRIVKENPSIQIVIDIHRDSIITKAGTMYKTITEANGENTAQMMFVVGTNDSGLTHPDWKNNLALAVQLQGKLLADTPNLMRPIDLRRERFNQHATDGSFILEVGTSGNTLQEALAAIRRFGDVAGDYIYEQLKDVT